MENRTSVRTYSEELPEGELLGRIQRILSKDRKGPFGNRYSMTLMDMDDEKNLELGKMTSYGMIKGARFYFGGFADGDDRAIIDYGYCFEEVVLELTAEGLGTCWMGGTFSRGFMAKMLSLPEGKVIPGISPFGFPVDKRRPTEKLTRFLAGSKKRKAHNKLFFNQGGGDQLEPVITDELRSPVDEIFEAVRFAPSASNKQPWRIIIQDEYYHFYIDYNKTYNGMMKGFNIQALDGGIALCHFTKAAEELRFKGKLSYADPKFENIKWSYLLSWKVSR